MKNISSIIYPLLVSMIMAGCSDSSEITPDVPKTVIDNSLAIFNGDIDEQSQSIEDGLETWELVIQNGDGSTVKFYWTTTDQVLLKIEGIQGPYDYVLDPQLGLINYATARTQAISAVKNNNILRWELEQNDDFIDKWIYAFDFDIGGNRTEVYVDGTNGDVLEIN